MAKKQTEAKTEGGYRKVASGSFAPNWDYKKEPILEGKVISKKKVPFKRGKKTEEVFVIEVAQATGEIVNVWESHATAALMEEVKIGQGVKIEFKGVKKLKGKKTLKEFETFIAD